nr:MAG TPA: HopJ type III effector protein [Caudoviricetes sp.]
MLVGRLTHLAKLNISHVPCVQGVLGVVNSGSCKILSLTIGV